MRAAVLREYDQPLSIEEVDPPDCPDHGVVVAVEACGICRSDWHAWKGHGEWADDRAPLGLVLGHEPAGRVVVVGADVTTLAEGDRVAVPFNLGCGDCRYCQNGHGNVCPDGLALGFEERAPGAFAERVAVPWADYNAVRVPDIDPTALAALGCRYVTAYHALEHRADAGAGDWVAVFGCGGVGLSAVQVADAVGASVVAVDIDDAKLSAAREVGADATVDADREDAAAPVRAATDGGAHVSLDALGSAETARAGVESLRPLGTHVQVGLTGEAERGEISLPTDAMAGREVTFHGARGMPPSRYDELLRMLAAGRLDPGALVSRTVALEEVPDRLAAMDDYATAGVEVVTEF